MQPVGSYFIDNNTVQPVAKFTPYLSLKGDTIYEVLRVAEGIPLFAEDHLERFRKSLRIRFGTAPENALKVIEALRELILANNLKYGNIRFTYTVTDNTTTFLAFQIPHHYPLAQAYRQGVPVSTTQMVRSLPNVKIQVDDYKQKVNSIINTNMVYEVLLANNHNFITEGSRSNFFYVRRGMLYTAPSELVLEGISRKVVLRLAATHGLPVVQEPLDRQKLASVSAACLTGTSPGVLPISRIDAHRLHASSAEITELLKVYSIEVKNYINNHK